MPSSPAIRCLLLVLAASYICICAAESYSLPSPKAHWKAAAERSIAENGIPNGRWWSWSGYGSDEAERIGQVCDHYLRVDEDVTLQGKGPDIGKGCIAVWVADKHDNFTVGNLPANQQDNFLNTQLYKKAMQFSDDAMGLRAGSLPIPGRDWDPVCYITTLMVENWEGVAQNRTVLGYEETNGDRMLPCPGAREGLNFTEEQIKGATDGELQSMCEACYQSVCSGEGATDARNCGSGSDGGVDIGDDADEAHMVEQVSTAYHCHLTMADRGACDYVHYNQHVESRQYLMESGVLCGWDRVRELNITHCDCTRKYGTANGCGSDECVDMAIAGVVCGNCDNEAGCSESRAYEAVFDKNGMPDPYEGSCARALHAKERAEANGQDPEGSEEYLNAKQECTKGLYCRDAIPASQGKGSEPADSQNSAGCTYYCGIYGDVDPGRCPDGKNSRRRLLGRAGLK